MSATVPTPRNVFRDAAKVGLAVWDQTALFYTSLMRSPYESIDLNEFYVEYEGGDIKLAAENLAPAADATVFFTPPEIKGPRPWGLVEVAVGITPNDKSTLKKGVYQFDIVNDARKKQRMISPGFTITYNG